jgi:hypothetical protein
VSDERELSASGGPSPEDESARRGDLPLPAEAGTWSEGVVMALLLAGALAVRLIPLGFGIESTDIRLYRQQAIPVVQMKNLYAVTQNVFPYAPVSMWYPALCLELSWLLGIPFDVVIKLFAIVSDVGIVLALYALGGVVLPRRTAACGAALYALSPVSILVSSFHGNIMPLVVLLMLAAYLLFRADPDANLTVSGLLLGLAVGWRSFPILLLPFFLVSIAGTPKRVRFAACVVAPVALSMVPFLLVDWKPMLAGMLGYSGWGIHHGPFAILRGLYLLSIGRITWDNPAEWAPWVAASKLAFLALYAIAVLRAKRIGLLNGILVTFLLFEVVYAGVASQYLIWALPFLLLTERKTLFWCYQLAATYALVVFYWIFFPDILFGTLDLPRVGVASLLRQYVISQAVFSAVCAAGIVVFGKAVAAPVGAAAGTGTVAAQGRRGGVLVQRLLV